MNDSRCRILRLPRFPADRENESDSSFDPETLLGGFVVAPENRLAELAARLAIDGVPIFDRPIGDKPLDAVRTDARIPSRADFEALFRVAKDSDEPLDQFFQRAKDDRSAYQTMPLFDRDAFNAARANLSRPKIVEYQPLENVPFLAPLIFYGPSGVGKSRLIEGICQQRRLADPRQTLYRLSANDFAKALLDAVRRNQTQLFRALFAQAAVVAIENVDAIAEKQSAQEEFLPILDDAIKARKLVILSFSQPPNAAKGFIPDLAARFAAGLLAPLRLPSDDAKRFAVKRVAEKLNVAFDDDALDVFVKDAPSTIPALCAAVVQTTRELALRNATPDKTAVEKSLKRRLPKREWTVDQLIKPIAKQLGAAVGEMRGKSRAYTPTFARKCVVFFARRLTDASFEEIGRAFSGRDHSTMLHAYKEIENAFRYDPETRQIILKLAQALGVDDLV